MRPLTRYLPPSLRPVVQHPGDHEQLFRRDRKALSPQPLHVVQTFLAADHLTRLPLPLLPLLIEEVPDELVRLTR